MPDFTPIADPAAVSTAGLRARVRSLVSSRFTPVIAVVLAPPAFLSASPPSAPPCGVPAGACPPLAAVVG